MGKGKEWNIENLKRTVARKLALEENKLQPNRKTITKKSAERLAGGAAKRP